MQTRLFFCTLIFLVLLMGCQMTHFPEPSPGTLPAAMPDPPMEENVYYPNLKQYYGDGETYERVKIAYLFEITRNAPFSFIRNGVVFDPRTTAEHLERKYENHKDVITTAQQFIDQIASHSSSSGRSYLALDKEGNTYFTRDLLHYELKRLENFMDKQKKPPEGEPNGF